MKHFATISVLALSLFALSYNRDNAVEYAKKYYKEYNPAYPDYSEGDEKKCGDCANFVSQCIIAGLQGEQMAYGPRWSIKEWEKFKKTHKKRRFWFDPYGTLPYAPHLRDFLRDEWGLKDAPYHFIWQPGQRPTSPPSGIQPGDIAFYGTSDCRTKHAMIIIDIKDGKIIYAGHCRNMKKGNLLKTNPGMKLEVFHIPNTIMNCGRLYYFYTSDSTFIFTWFVRHSFICCWHERLGGQSPWASNPTAYACLSWDENRGTTWDTLISPRMNFASCSAAVFRQRSISTLQHGANKVIEIRGSTNDGATWPYLIGTDITTEASFPGATNQRNVRIAWIYKGPVEDAEII